MSMPNVLLISLTIGASLVTGPSMYGDFTPVIIAITWTLPSNSGKILAPQNTVAHGSKFLPTASPIVLTSSSFISGPPVI